MINEKSDKVLINASNLHSGGAVQVAVSFLNELIHLKQVDIDVIVSSKVHRELKSINAEVERFSSYNIYDTSGFSALIDFKFTNIILSYGTVFTIFGF